MTFSHPQTATSAQAATTEAASFRNETAYGSLFLEPDLPAGTDSDVDFDEPEFVEPTRETGNRQRRNNGHGRNDPRRSNRRRTAA